MPSAILKRYHASVGKSVTSFMVGRRRKARCFSALQYDAIGRAPRGRELSVREDLTRIIVDWSGSWQAARPGNWLGWSPATKAALGR